MHDGRTMKTDMIIRDDLTINYRDEQVYDDTNSKIVIFCLERRKYMYCMDRLK